MITKKSKRVLLAHPICALKKNWISQEEIDNAERFKNQFIQMVS